MDSPVFDINIDKLDCNQSTKQILLQLLNYIECQHKEINDLKQENQKLRDEISKLKGEKGKPVILSNTQRNKNISSEAYSRTKKKWNKKPKKNLIEIDNKVHCPLERDGLPADLQYKGRETIINQDIIFRRNNTEYTVEIWYSPSEKKTYRSSPPKDDCGYFGNNLKAFSMVMYYAMDITRGKLTSFLRGMGIEISDGSLQNILVQNSQGWLKERDDLLKSGLQGPYLQTDSTGARVNGRNHFTHVFVSEFFAVFATQPGKSRLDLLCALQGQTEEGLMLQYNQTTIGYLTHYNISEKDRQDIHQLFSWGDTLTQKQFRLLVEEQMPWLAKKKQIYKWVVESMAFGHFFEQTIYPCPKVLITDDAKEYILLSKSHMLCWIHDARYYNKLVPICRKHIDELDTFRDKYWGFYNLLKEYKRNPGVKLKGEIVCKFDQLFAPVYNYFDLNKQIKRTLSNKKQLLAVLDFPFIPLHNNAAELAVRKQVRKRDICLHTMTGLGTKLQDAFLSITQTATLLGINAYQYILDRINDSPPFYLPDLVVQRIKDNQLKF